MAARFPLRALLRDVVMMLFGSMLGLLLARAVFDRDLRLSDVTKLCGTIHVTKRGGGMGLQPSGYHQLLVGSGDTDRGGEINTGTYPYQGPAGSGSAEKGKEFQSVSLGTGAEKEIIGPETTQDVHDDQDSSDKDQDIHKVPMLRTNVHLKAKKPLLVGVVVEESRIHEAMWEVDETWGQSWTDILFYSIPYSLGKAMNEELWLRRKRRKRQIVKLKSKSSNSRNLISVLKHMYNSGLVNQYDWFMYIPDNTYVRLDNMERLLESWNQEKPVCFGRNASRDSEMGNSRLSSGNCDEEKGVVMNRKLLLEVGALVNNEDACSGRKLIQCLAWYLGVECIPQYQVNELMTGVIPPLPRNSTSLPVHPTTSSTPPLHTRPWDTIYTLHQHFLLKDLNTSITKTATLRSQLAKNSRRIRKR